MIVIIEGSDGSGKSSLIKQLQKSYDFEESVPKSLPTFKTTKLMCNETATAINASLYNGKDIILDRGWMSEAIYSSILRNRPSRFSLTHMRMFERMALSTGVTIIHCNPGREQILKNLTERGDEHIRDIKTLDYIISAYKDFNSLTSIPVLDYNYLEHDTETLGELIWDTASGGHTGKTLFGNGWADILVVVQPSYIQGSVPMVSWDEDSIAWKITETFEEVGITEYELAWTSQTGSQLRNIIVNGDFTRVLYIGAKLATMVEESLSGLDVQITYLPEPVDESTASVWSPLLGACHAKTI